MHKANKSDEGGSDSRVRFQSDSGWLTAAHQLGAFT